MGKRRKNDRSKIAFIVAAICVCTAAVGFFVKDMAQGILKTAESVEEGVQTSPLIEDLKDLTEQMEKAGKEIDDAYIPDDILTTEDGLPVIQDDEEAIPLLESSAEAAKAEASHDESPVEEKDMAVPENKTGTLVRVVDGDTYIINIDGVETRVRLIGVDTPESVAPADYAENTPEGAEVSDIMKNKLSEGESLTVEYDVSPTDKYGRTLAYVYFSDGKMIQKWLLENGLANTMTIPPNVKYADDFASIAHKASEEKIGLWNGFFEVEE